MKKPSNIFKNFIFVFTFLFIFCFSFILSGCFVFGADFNFDTNSKTSFNPGESVLFKLSFGDGVKLLNVLDVSDFSFFDSAGVKQSINLELIKISDVAYIGYFDMPAVLNSNFSFGLVNLQYFSGSELRKNSFKIDLFINNESVGVSFRPGYIQLLNIESYEQPSLSFTVKNRFDVFGSVVSVNVSVDSDFLVPVLSSFSLGSGEQKTIEVKTKVLGKNKDVFSGNVIFDYGSSKYSVPVKITRKGFVVVASNETVVNNTSVVNNTVPEERVEFGSLVLISPDLTEVREENLKMSGPGSAISGNFVFKNKGKSDLKNLVVSYIGLEDVLFIDKNKVDVLKAGDQVNFSLLINTTKAKKDNYKGDFILSAENGVSVKLPFFLKIKDFPAKSNISVVNNSVNIIPVSNISNNTVPVVEEQSSFTVWFVVLLIVVVIGGIVYYLYTKQKPKQQAYENLVESFRQRK